MKTMPKNLKLISLIFGASFLLAATPVSAQPFSAAGTYSSSSTASSRTSARSYITGQTVSDYPSYYKNAGQSVVVPSYNHSAAHNIHGLNAGASRFKEHNKFQTEDLEPTGFYSPADFSYRGPQAKS